MSSDVVAVWDKRGLPTSLQSNNRSMVRMFFVFNYKLDKFVNVSHLHKDMIKLSKESY